MSATQSIALIRGRTHTDYAYEADSDLDWMRDRFAVGATATAPNATWMGIDYGYDKSGRLTQMSATDSAIMGAMPVVGTNGTANNINRVASVAGRASCRRAHVLRWRSKRRVQLATPTWLTRDATISST
jgi:hypothetical protein